MSDNSTRGDKPPLRCLGLITARAGSTGVPGKNIASCGGLPLIAWTCRAALESRLETVVVSTDGKDISETAARFGVEAPFVRPPALSGDEVSSLEVARHAVQWMADHRQWVADAVMVLQPTSPLRRAHHIDEALDKLSDGVDTVVSVCQVPHHYLPWSIMTHDDNHGLRSWTSPPEGVQKYRRQGQPELYYRNGPAVLLCRTAILESGDFYSGHTVAMEMTPEDSVDIDTPLDLEIADLMLRQRFRATP